MIIAIIKTTSPKDYYPYFLEKHPTGRLEEFLPGGFLFIKEAYKLIEFFKHCLFIYQVIVIL